MKLKSIYFIVIISVFFLSGCNNSFTKATDEKMTFKIGVENRKYDQHRPDGVTVVTIKVAQWPGNEFGLWLPEDIMMGEKFVWTDWQDPDVWPNWKPGDAYQDFTQRPDGSLVWKKTFKDIDFRSELRPDEKNSCIWYKHTFTNISDKPLYDLNAISCFHLVNAPQFISIDGSRYWADLDGKWTTTDTVPRCESPDPRRIGFKKQGLRQERTVVPNFVFPSAVMPQASCHPLFIAESFDAAASVGVADRNYDGLFNNNDSVLRCLHSHPAPIKVLQPGQTVEREAVIVFCRGNHNDLLKHYEKITADVWK